MADDQNAFLTKRKLAVLVDGDNAQASCIKEILAEAGKNGRIVIRRIYGDWSGPNMASWKDFVQENALQPIQQFPNTDFKNATDIVLIIDAMDILHSGVVDGFCLVTSDSDYTRLAIRLRESGAYVMGFGKKNTPKAFTRACDRFVPVEELQPPVKQPPSASIVKVVPSLKEPRDALPLLAQAMGLSSQENGWVSLNNIGLALKCINPNFDSRTFGCSNLRTLVLSFPDIIDFQEKPGSGGNKVIFIKFKRQKKVAA